VEPHRKRVNKKIPKVNPPSEAGDS